MTTPAVLEVQDLSRAFGGLRAVEGLTFDIHQGEVFGLIGPNGSGKTTALNLISGALRPDRGRVRFAGQDIAGAPPHQIARRGLARTFQLVRVFRTMTVRENVLAGLLFSGRIAQAGGQAVDPLLARVGLGEHGERLASELTYIDQKRLELARALAAHPRLLLLDEWLAGLNPTELGIGLGLIRSLRGDGITVLMVEHVMHAIRSLCDRCLVMNAGLRIALGPPAQVLADPQVVSAYLGEEEAAAAAPSATETGSA